METKDIIKGGRIRLGMTHQAFADAVGVSRGAVQQWEKGDTSPTRKHQPRVAELLGISIAELIAPGDSPAHCAGAHPVQSAAQQEQQSEIRQTIERLGEMLADVDVNTRETVAELLLRYAQNPAEGERLADAIEVLMKDAPPHYDEAPQRIFRQRKVKRVELTNLLQRQKSRT